VAIRTKVERGTTGEPRDVRERVRRLRSGAGAAGSKKWRRQDEIPVEDEDPEISTIQRRGPPRPDVGELDDADVEEEEERLSQSKVERAKRGPTRKRPASTKPEASGGGARKGPKKPGTKTEAGGGRTKSKSSGGRGMAASGSRTKKAANRKQPASGKRSSSKKRP
jgi:hypothetical protein